MSKLLPTLYVTHSSVRVLKEHNKSYLDLIKSIEYSIRTVEGGHRNRQKILDNLLVSSRNLPPYEKTRDIEDVERIVAENLIKKRYSCTGNIPAGDVLTSEVVGTSLLKDTLSNYFFNVTSGPYLPIEGIEESLCIEDFPEGLYSLDYAEGKEIIFHDNTYLFHIEKEETLTKEQSLIVERLRLFEEKQTSGVFLNITPTSAFTLLITGTILQYRYFFQSSSLYTEDNPLKHLANTLEAEMKHLYPVLFK